MEFRKGDPITVISKKRKQFGLSGIVKRVVEPKHPEASTFVDVYMDYGGSYHCYFAPDEIRLDAIIALGMLAK